MASTDQQAHHRTVVSYVRRGERMTAGQERAWQEHWGTLGLDLADWGGREQPIDEWFGRQAPLLLEIGSGMGETTAQLAAADPSINYLAIEVYKPGLAQLLMRAVELGATNLRALRGDAVDLLTSQLPAGSLSGARIFFPDPWPKSRHHKRRLIQPRFVALLCSRLAPGATLHLATDWADYADQMAEVCGAEPTLRNRYADEPGGWAPRPQWRPVTKFERRARAEGRVSRDLIYERRA
ncbi:tRNA (guanosine(46)-N7)-methyltransferase TrmB [Actinoalloteichus hymeniacidonis]|uniref:tRNA (guanine-N(7)-)-methyltransferase n=1 Tax=Actinoalloteichus hymeniacidonis TaxID=340345 RepID=A0AAC9HUY1_9PSEU|nr:tRNA (guanosine(46)-N7)-methyltransferase TrmB [Actinoalloteichus hymeniacidonis]AOS66022.1 tRNA (guanine-N(7)-)-methyltransferase [Actinoalloteichus hymeniacidonis]MBB5905876.1 tRNA (guanine-N7-)-methyltransferase [Actinoalloteichus hymeniacidonis]